MSVTGWLRWGWRARASSFSGFCLLRSCVFLLCSAPWGLLPAAALTAHSVLGGRFKKEIVVDGQSYLLLIRDEGGPPELQVRLLPSSGH